MSQLCNLSQSKTNKPKNLKIYPLILRVAPLLIWFVVTILVPEYLPPVTAVFPPEFGGGGGSGNLGRIQPPPIGNIGSFTGAGGAAAVIKIIIQLLFIIGFISAFICILVGAIRWIASGGDPKNIQSARNQIISCLAGLVILVSIFAIITIVENIFGVRIITGGILIPTL